MAKNFSKQVGRFLKNSFPAGTPKNKTVSTYAGGKTTTEDKPVVIRRTPIMWGIPCDEVSYSEFWIGLEERGNKMPWDWFASSKGTYLPKARNTIHNAFRKSDLEFMMMLDSDILFPHNMVEKLLAYNLPIVGGWYRDKNADDHHPVVYDFLNEEASGVINWRHRSQPGTGLEKVDGMGAGCWLMRKDVAQALGDDPYNLHYGGEDLVLSRKIMKLNIPMYVDWSLNCAHLGVRWT